MDSLFIPAILTLLGNILFYVAIKEKIDNSIEQFKISYSGVFKEKIEVHKTLLKLIYDLKSKIQYYQYAGNNDEMSNEIFMLFKGFIDYYTINKPFIKDEILHGLIAIREELQSCFDVFYTHNTLLKIELDKEQRIDLANKFFKAGEKFKTDEPFKSIESKIISEMKNELRIK